ncbi:hypothetical protein [Limosilactobacillus mucosae]|jgi:hypothetical protein|uniref:hypothetical protein n=1 Tax=Limosilactobacillus mucosae TaxID=97478 RepID=UPI0020455D7E|nr:hypothetical protein [Limosilactobacillus mucosae]DAV97261.1 MAG TPA: hypothetical protein [Bacteriophage sp.]
MTSYITPRLLQAINSLEKRYPEAFKVRYGKDYQLERWIPVDDPDMRVRNQFLAQIKIGDQRKKQNYTVMHRVLDCYNRYMTTSEAAKYLNMDFSDVKYITDTNPRLRETYAKKQHDFKQIVVYDRINCSYQVYRDQYQASIKLGFQRSSDLTYYIKQRHYPYFIKGRYKAKRKVWFDEDNGM